MSRFQFGWIAVLALALTSGAPARDEESSRDDLRFAGAGGYSIQIDNDLFSGAHRDQDYSWGFAVTRASPQPGKLLRPLHSIRNMLNEWLVPDESESGRWAPEHQATQMGILAMTPESLRSSEPLYGDRPFANLIFVTSSEITIEPGARGLIWAGINFERSL